MAHKIIDVIKGNPNIGQAELSEILDVPRRTLQRKMIDLQHIGKIKRVGGKRYGHWEADING